MRKVEYAPLVRTKMKQLKKWLTEHFDEKVAKKVLKGMVSDADKLGLDPEIGTCIAETYDIETEYRYLFSCQHYLIYRIERRLPDEYRGRVS
ncbi:MAG: hypothetical protein K6G24_06645 [Lachnospiraceae bacterium]|nr:hypothetical protein [Lachnospiraceae bacterium]